MAVGHGRWPWSLAFFAGLVLAMVACHGEVHWPWPMATTSRHGLLPSPVVIAIGHARCLAALFRAPTCSAAVEGVHSMVWSKRSSWKLVVVHMKGIIAIGHDMAMPGDDLELQQKQHNDMAGAQS